MASTLCLCMMHFQMRVESLLLGLVSQLLIQECYFSTVCGEDCMYLLNFFIWFRACGGVEGIVNGMDTTEWSPSVDKFLDVTYDEETMDVGKAAAKEALQVGSCMMYISFIFHF